MKIEIGESLMLSWLRHAKGCQLVQLNWKPSVNRWALYNEAALERIMMETADLYRSEKFRLEIFPKEVSRSQLMQQGEIDALGIEVRDGGQWYLYGVDVAFHESGLGYGNPKQNATRVLKKLIRMAMCIYGFCGRSEADLIFASPKVHEGTDELLLRCVDELNSYFSQTSLKFKATLYTNEEFKRHIFDVVMTLSSSISDTPELFLRSIQLSKLFENPTGNFVSLKKSGRSPIANQEIKIGAFVRAKMDYLVERNLLSELEITNLQQENYSKISFNLNYPALKAYQEGKHESDQRNVNGRPRYYAETYTIRGRKYFLYNDWYEDRNRDRFLNWLDGLQG